MNTEYGFHHEPQPQCDWCGAVAFAGVVVVWIVGFCLLSPYM